MTIDHWELLNALHSDKPGLIPGITYGSFSTVRINAIGTKSRPWKQMDVVINRKLKKELGQLPFELERLNNSFWIQRDSTMGKVIALHIANPGLTFFAYHMDAQAHQK